MLLLRTEKAAGRRRTGYQFELKLDGYRASPSKTGGKVQLRSRNDNDFNARYPGRVKALAPMPDETVIDGEVVALDAEGRPSFNTLQNYGSSGAPLHFFIFDLLILKGKRCDGRTAWVSAASSSKNTFCRSWRTRSGIPRFWTVG
jgi:ATP-dependent DNA ligase